MALHDLIEHCGYPASIKNELIHDRLVVGIRDTKLSQTLQMDTFLMLERAKRQICQKEAIGEQQHTLKREVEVKPGGSRSNSTELDAVTTRCVHQLQCRHLSRNASGSSFTGRQQVATPKQQCTQCRRGPHNSLAQQKMLYATSAREEDTLALIEHATQCSLNSQFSFSRV